MPFSISLTTPLSMKIELADRSGFLRSPVAKVPMFLSELKAWADYSKATARRKVRCENLELLERLEPFQCAEPISGCVAYLRFGPRMTCERPSSLIHLEKAACTSAAVSSL